MSSVLSLKPSYYEALKRLTLELAGINLGKDHAFLIESRLSTLARKEGFKDLNHLVDELFSEGQARLAIQVVSSLLERDTHFFYDGAGFDVLERVLLPRLMAARTAEEPIKILSFGCSSGQEVYSAAIMIARNPELAKQKFEITGVDYPSPALDRARRGQYTHFEVQRGLPIRDLINYFDRHGEDWLVKDALRHNVSFREFHLLSNLDELGKYDVILFRNSLSHYSMPAQIRVLRSISSIINPGGLLVLGSSEATSRGNLSLSPLPDYPFVLSSTAQPAAPEPIS